MIQQCLAVSASGIEEGLQLMMPASMQFLREAGIHPQLLPLPGVPSHAVQDSQLDKIQPDEFQPTWNRAPTPALLQVPLLATQKQHRAPVQSRSQTEMLLRALSGDCTAAALPEEDEQISLAQLWSTDEFMKQRFATQLMHEPPQPPSWEDHKILHPDKMTAAQPAQEYPSELPQLLMCPRPDSRAVIQSALSSMKAPLPLTDDARDDVAQGLTFHDLVAPGQVLSDEYPSLPLVHVKDRPADSLAAWCGPTRLAQTLQAKPVSLAAAELLLDWSLRDPAAPDPSKRIQQVGHSESSALHAPASTQEMIHLCWPGISNSAEHAFYVCAGQRKDKASAHASDAAAARAALAASILAGSDAAAHGADLASAGLP